MRFKDVFNFRVFRLNLTDVWLNFSQRINDCYFSFTLDIIGSLSKATSIDLFDFHSTILDLTLTTRFTLLDQWVCFLLCIKETTP